MIRKIIHIDEEKCNGCGLCARACHESAIGIIDGKAKLLREDYCDGLETASLPVQQMPFLLQKRRQLLTTKPQFWKIRKSWKHTPSFNSGRYRLSQFPSMLHILTMLTFLLLQTAQPMLTQTSIKILSKVRLLLSAVRNWTLQITAKSSPKSSVRTISRVLPSCAWKFHAAAESRMQP